MYEFVNENTLNVTEYKVLGKLPDPFTFDNGERVKTKEDWTKRRAEIYKTAVELQYGTLPPAPEVLEVETLYKSSYGTPSSYKIKAGTKDAQVTFRMVIILPPEENFDYSDGKKPPVIVDGDLCFKYFYDKEFIATALNEGIGWVVFDRTELAHDVNHEGRSKGSLYGIYPEYTFGALGAWAWGYSRCVDALEVLGIADMSCIAFTGHSRGGKTAALAGAVDERAAIVNANATCAGAFGCYRLHIKGYCGDNPEKRSEKLADIYKTFPFWFSEKLGEYANREEELPFDAHMLKAMVAPRILFVSEAAGDLWANPVGSWHTTIAAKEVFDFLDAGDNVYWYFREGPHYHDIRDIKMLVSIIKHKAEGREICEGFFQTPFKPFEPIYDWSAPNKE